MEMIMNNFYKCPTCNSSKYLKVRNKNRQLIECGKCNKTFTFDFDLVKFIDERKIDINDRKGIKEIIRYLLERDGEIKLLNKLIKGNNPLYKEIKNKLDYLTTKLYHDYLQKFQSDYENKLKLPREYSFKIYCVLHNITKLNEIPHCPECNRICNFKSIKEGFKTYCPDCVRTSKDIVQKKKETLRNKISKENKNKDYELIKLIDEIIYCPYEDCENYLKKGNIKILNWKQKRFQCKVCKRTFKFDVELHLKLKDLNVFNDLNGLKHFLQSLIKEVGEEHIISKLKLSKDPLISKIWDRINELTENTYQMYLVYLDQEFNIKKVSETLKLYMIFNNLYDLKDFPKCKECGKITLFKSLTKGFNNYCSNGLCQRKSKEVIQKRKETIKQKFGVEHYLQRKDVLEKQLTTLKEKYGGTGFQSPTIKEKIFETLKEKYGVENHSELSKFTWEKRKETNIKKYGIDMVPNLPKYIEKRKNWKENFEKSLITIYKNKGIKNPEIIREKELLQKEFGNLNEKQFKKNFQEILKMLQLNVNVKFNVKINNWECDVFIPQYNLIIEFNGVNHYKSAYTIEKDQRKLNDLKNAGYHILEIPYFISFDKTLIEKIFKIKLEKEIFNAPHGFWYWTNYDYLPASFCFEGIKRFEKDLIKFSWAKEDIIESLKIKIIKLGKERKNVVIPKSLEYLIKV